MNTIDRIKRANTRSGHARNQRPGLPAVFGLLCLLVVTSAAQALTPPKALPDLVAESNVIVEATLVSAQSRWNDRGNLIVTDYRFHAERILSGMPTGSDFTLTQAGGRIGNRGYAVSDEAALQIGNSYLLFVSPNPEKSLVPFVGGAQGVFVQQADGTLRSLGAARKADNASQLLSEVEDLLARRGAAPARKPFRRYVPTHPYPAKNYVPVATVSQIDGWVQEPATAMPSADTAPQGPSLPAQASPIGIELPPVGFSPQFVFPLRIDPPVTFNQLSATDAPFSPVDQNMMAEWNKYGGTLFKTFATPDPDWAFGNGRFDIAGFPTEAQMIEQFGAGFGGALAKTVTMYVGTKIIEADIMLNPDACWTINETEAQDPDNPCWGFRQVLLHELGHAWGLGHPFETQDVWWDSVMNYFGKPFNRPLLRADDVNALRAAFASTPARHDALISLYETVSQGITQTPQYLQTQPARKHLYHGESLTAGNNHFTIENLGTDVFTSPKVDFYLTPSRLSWVDAIYIGSKTYGSMPVFNMWKQSMPDLTVSPWTPTGEYFLAAYLRNSDYNAANNSSWVSNEVYIDNNVQTLVPEYAVQLVDGGPIGNLGNWNFEFQAVAGQTYWFSLCPDKGGTANFDSTLWIQSGGMLTWEFNDDFCGLSSAVKFTPLPFYAPGTYSLTVGTSGGHGHGSFTLAYWRTDDVIFKSGFEVE